MSKVYYILSSAEARLELNQAFSSKQDEEEMEKEDRRREDQRRRGQETVYLATCLDLSRIRLGFCTRGLDMPGAAYF